MTSFPSRIGLIFPFVVLSCFAAAAATPGIAIAGPTAPIHVPTSGTGIASFTITPLHGFNGGLWLQCQIAPGSPNAMNAPNCNGGPVANPSLTISSAKPMTWELEIYGPRAAIPAAQTASGGLWMAYGGLTFACVLLLWMPKRYGNWRSLLGLLLMAFSFACIGCGSSSSYTFNLTGVNAATKQTMATTSFTVIVH